MRKRRTFAHIKQGWEVIGEKRIYFRSGLEVKKARDLELLKIGGYIKEWFHEPETFYFEGIKRGTTNYKPDFKVINMDDSHYWIEAKGWWDAKSKTKVKRFRKYFPNEKLVIYPSDMEAKL